MDIELLQLGAIGIIFAFSIKEFFAFLARKKEESNIKDSKEKVDKDISMIQIDVAVMKTDLTNHMTDYSKSLHKIEEDLCECKEEIKELKESIHKIDKKLDIK